MWEVSAHPHLLWAYSGVVGGGLARLEGQAYPTLTSRAAFLSLPNSRADISQAGNAHKPGAGIWEGLT